MGLFKRGNVWWASVVHDGKQYRFSCKTSDKSEAQAVYAKVLLELKQGNVRVKEKVKKERITFRQFFIEQYLPFCKKQASYEVKRYALNMIPE